MSLGAGKADFLELGDWNAQCYQCGRKFKASTMVRNWQGYFVCPPHNEPRQTQDFVRNVPDNPTPPWVQPMPNYTFAGFCSGNATSAYAGDATAGCVQTGYVSPLYFFEI